jgi:hypothetical protein
LGNRTLERNGGPSWGSIETGVDGLKS